MFDYDPNKLGVKIAEGMNATIHKYDDEKYLVKRFIVFSEAKERQFTEEYMLGINHNHQNILNYQGFSKRIIDPVEKWSEIYIKMKPMEKDLQQYIKEYKNNGHNKLPIDDVIRIFYSLAKALDYLKKKGIAHSNIVQESILFDENGIVKLAGFAFSKFKPWKNTEKRIYQSYFPPEMSDPKPKEQKIDGQMTNEEKKEKIKEAKELAFKSDVWCLGKLMVDVCLLRDQADKGKKQKANEILKKTEDDLADIQAKYKREEEGEGEEGKTLTSILRSLLKREPKDRLSFAKICDALEQRFPQEVLNAQLNNDDDDNSSVSNDSFTSLPEEEESKTGGGVSQAQTASQSGSNSILNEGMMMVETSFALSLSTFIELRNSISTRDTSQSSDNYLPLLHQFYQSSELHNQVVRCFLSEISSQTNLSEPNSNPSAQPNPNFSHLFNALNENLKTLSNQTVGKNPAQQDLLSLPQIPGYSNLNSDSNSFANSNSPDLLTLLRQQINAKISKSQNSESNSAPMNLPDINPSESDKASELKKSN